MPFHFSFIAVFLHFFLAGTLSSQPLQFHSATLQNTYQGAAPMVTVNYAVYFTKKKNQELIVDSIKSVVDKKNLPFSLFRKKDTLYLNYGGNKLLRGEKGIFRISFGITNIISGEPSEAYSENSRPIQYDMSKGICIYYTLAGKKKTCTINNFKELPKITPP